MSQLQKFIIKNSIWISPNTELSHSPTDSWFLKILLNFAMIFYLHSYNESTFHHQWLSCAKMTFSFCKTRQMFKYWPMFFPIKWCESYFVCLWIFWRLVNSWTLHFYFFCKFMCCLCYVFLQQFQFLHQFYSFNKVFIFQLDLISVKSQSS